MLGTHQGSFGFTVGQRRGLQLDRPAPGGEPRYVLSIQPTTNRVVVGRGELLDVDEVRADRVPCGRPPSRRPASHCSVQLRAHGMVSAGRGVRRRRRHRRPARRTPQRGVAAGQALVMYDGDVVHRLGDDHVGRARS